MRMKKLLSLGIVVLLILSMAIVMVPVGQAGYTPHLAQALWLEPSFTGTLNKSDTFTVSIVVNITDPPGSATGLHMWEYKLRWNTSWVTLSSRKGVIEAGDNDTRLGWGLDYSIVKDLTGTEGGLAYHWYAVSKFVPAPAFTGVMWICNYTFHVEDQPYQPAPNYVGNLTMYQTFCDDTISYIFEGIYPEEEDYTIGTFEVLSVPLPPPELEVKPAQVQGVWGEKFNITIEIDHLIEAANMCRWNATLSYNTTMLDAEASFEGPFLDGFGNAGYTYVINDVLGKVYTTGFFLTPPATPPYRTGVLATIEFNATWQYTVSSTNIPPITSSLSLYNNKTVSCANLFIKSTVGDPATYIAPYKPEVIDHPIEWPPASGEFYHVSTVSNSSVSPVPMIFNQSGKYISFNVTGTAGYYGFCKVTIPEDLLWAAPWDWIIFVDSEPPLDWDYTANATHTVLYFTYQFLSTRTVRIIGDWAIGSPPLEYTLAIDSSPTGVTFTVDGVSRTTPWSGTYSKGASVSLVMPETYDEYVWLQWLEDEDASRTKTIVLTGNTTWTAVFTILGDINGDGIVNIKDIGICCKAFGSYPGDPRWKPQADLDKEHSPNLIDIYDLVTVAVNFGKKW